MKRTVSLSVDTSTDEEFVTIYEKLARQAAGLQLDGVQGRVFAYDEDDEDET